MTNFNEHALEAKQYELIFVERGTIILDASLLRCRTQGRLRFTAAHELAHWLIHQELYSGTGDMAAMLKSISKSSDADKYKNATYMGYICYNKSRSNNYLEQKRINNLDETTYELVNRQG